MIYVGTRLKVADNSGGKIAECIRVLGVGRRKYGKVGEQIVVTIKVAEPEKQIGKGEVCRGVIVRVKKQVVRENGDSVRCDDNAVVLLTKKGAPIGTRVKGAVMSEVRTKGYGKVVSLAGVTI